MDSEPAADFNRCPVEIIWNICKYVETPEDLKNLKSVNRHLFYTVESFTREFTKKVKAKYNWRPRNELRSEKVKFLCIEFDEWSPYRGSFNKIMNLFPNTQHLVIDGVHSGDVWTMNRYPKIVTMRVNTFKLKTSGLPAVCPNVKKLTLTAARCKNLNLNQIASHCEKLEELEIIIDEPLSSHVTVFTQVKKIKITTNSLDVWRLGAIYKGLPAVETIILQLGTAGGNYTNVGAVLEMIS